MSNNKNSGITNNMNEQSEYDVSARLGIAESQIQNFAGKLDNFGRVLDEIRSSLEKSRETNWQTIIAFLMLLGAAWAALIHPISADVQRSESTAEKLAITQAADKLALASANEKLAERVFQQNKEIDTQHGESIALKEEVARTLSVVEKMASQLVVFNDRSSETHSDIRDLKLLVEINTKSIDKIRDEGSPLTTTKLALLADQITEMRDQVNHMNAYGTQDSDKRLSLIESKLNIADTKIEKVNKQ